MKSKVVIAEKDAEAPEEPAPKGIPEFWFTIFRNVDMLSELVQVSTLLPAEGWSSNGVSCSPGFLGGALWGERHSGPSQEGYSGAGPSHTSLLLPLERRPAT